MYYDVTYDFVNNLVSKLDFLIHHPALYQKRNNGERAMPLKPFNWLLIYRGRICKEEKNLYVLDLLDVRRSY